MQLLAAGVFVGLLASFATSRLIANQLWNTSPHDPLTLGAAMSLISIVALAACYGHEFHGKTAASGVRFDMNAMVAAHSSYPFGTIVRVTNLKNGRSVRVQILDRGPASGPRADGVIIDVSRAAAQALGFIREGRAPVRLEVLRWGTGEPSR